MLNRKSIKIQTEEKSQKKSQQDSVKNAKRKQKKDSKECSLFIIQESSNVLKKAFK
jgi:hypothetical protein